MLLFLQVLSPKDRQNDEYGALHASGIHCTGRIVLNVWRILRSELKLNIYTFESCVAAVLQLRTPHVQPHVLTQWFNAGPAGLHTSYSVPALTLTIILSSPPLHVCHHAFVDQCSQTMPRLGLPQRVTAESYTWAHRTKNSWVFCIYTVGPRKASQIHRAWKPLSQIFLALCFGHSLAPANQPLSCSMIDGMPNAGSTLPEGQFCDRWSVAMLAVLAATHPAQPSSA